MRKKILLILGLVLGVLALAIGFLWLGTVIGFLGLALFMACLAISVRKRLIETWRSGEPIGDITR